jgi:transglutaminase-like putative cysteine protease
VALLALLGGVEWVRVFGSGPLLWRVLLAAALPAAVAGTFRIWRPDDRVAPVVMSLVLLVVVLCDLVVGGGLGAVVPSTGSLHGVVSGLVNGWAQILSVPLPVPPTGELLVLPVAITWLAALVGVELFLSSRWPLSAAVPTAIAFALSLVFGIGGGGSRWVSATAFVGVCLVLAGSSVTPAHDRRGEARSARVRTVAEIGVCTVGISALAALLGPVLPFVSGHAYDPRAGTVPPAIRGSTLNPLDELSAWAHAPRSETLFTIRFAGAPQSTRLAVLTHYEPLNGWSSDARYQLTGRVLPAASSARGPTVVQTVTIGRLRGPWFPAAPEPVRLDAGAARTYADHSTDVLVAAGTHPGLRYTVVSEVAPPQCRLAPVVPFSAADRPQLPAKVVTLAESLAGAATSPCARAEQLASAFAARYTYSAHAPSGSSLYVLLNFLTGPKDAGGGAGTFEQFASSYGVLAEALGMPVRVVVGFHAGQPLGGGLYAVHPDDAYAWDEIDFQGVGWVPFFPAPRNGPAPKADRVDQAKSKFENTNANSGTTGGKGTPKEGASTAHGQHGTSQTVIAGLVVAAVVGALILVALASAALVATVTRRRRRRRRDPSADPRIRVLGAWDEALASLFDAGVRSRASDTAAEVVSAGSARLNRTGSSALGTLALLNNLARYSPTLPTAAEADEAWSYADVVETSVMTSLRPSGRVKRALDLRRVLPRIGDRRRRSHAARPGSVHGQDQGDAPSPPLHILNNPPGNSVEVSE